MCEVKVQCAWCKMTKTVTAPEPYQVGEVSHGICPECREEVMDKFESDLEEENNKKGLDSSKTDDTLE